MTEVKLVSPSGHTVVGFLATDGATCPFVCTLHSAGGNHNFAYRLPPDTLATLAIRGGERVCVDTAGVHWALSQVEFASVRA